MSEIFRIGTKSGHVVELKNHRDVYHLQAVSRSLGRPFDDAREVEMALKGTLTIPVVQVQQMQSSPA